MVECAQRVRGPGTHQVIDCQALGNGGNLAFILVKLVLHLMKGHSTMSWPCPHPQTNLLIAVPWLTKQILWFSELKKCAHAF